jgi:aspartate aminotransferase
MTLLRPEIEALEQNQITSLAFPRMGDPDIIPLWFGQGDQATPPFICDAAKTGLDEGQTFYTHTRGRQDLRDALKTYLDGLYGTDLNPDRITVPGAAMMGMTLATQMSLTTGLHGLIVGPAWQNIFNAMQVSGAELDYVRQHFSDGQWSLDLDELKAAVKPNTKAIFINTPCNPSGWVMPTEQQRDLLAYCREREILIISDEVYSRLVYQGKSAPSFVSIANDDDPVIVINGFSKSWAMTGWRLGWIVAPARYENILTSLSECFNTGANVFAQSGGIAALEHGEGWLQELRSQYQTGRDMVMEKLGDHPLLEISPPQGTFYAFPRMPGCQSSWRLAERLADEAKVGVSAGSAFGPGNDEHFRLCFAQSHERLAEGLNRIVGFLDKHGDELLA